MAASLVAMTTAATVLRVVVLAFLGHLGGDALYVRSVYVPFGFLSLALIEGITIAVQVSTAALHRRQRTASAGGLLVAATALGCGILVVLAVVVIAGFGLLTDLLNLAEGARGDIRTFVVAMLLANCVALPPALVSAVLRGLGNARASAILSVGDTVLAIATVYAVQAIFGAGLLSVPIGLVVGSVPAMVVALVMAARAGVVLRRPTSVRPMMRSMWAVAMPVAGSFLVLSGASLAYLHLLRDAGPDAIAGFGFGQVVQTFLIVPATAIGSAVAITLTLYGDAQRTGALRLLLRIALPTYLVIAAGSTLLRRPIVNALTSNAQARGVAIDYLGIIGPSLLLLGVTLTVLTYLEQSGHAVSAFVLNITFFAAIVAIAAALADPLHPHTLILLIALANVPGFVCVLLSARAMLRRRTEVSPS